MADHQLPLLAAAILATAAIYRAACFLHEIVHFQRRLPGFAAAWNILIGVPLLVPAHFYLGHLRHHRPGSYGGPLDPEYRRFPAEHPAVTLGYLLHPCITPLLLLVRFLLLGPAACLSARLRQRVDRFASTITIRFPMDSAPCLAVSRGDRAWEAACIAWAFALVALAIGGGIPQRAAILLYGIVTAAQIINAARTLVAHRYALPGPAGPIMAQFRDSYNHGHAPLLGGLWAPIGLRFHALHHLAPWLPYHALPAAHRRLTEHLDWYRAAEAPGFWRLLLRQISRAPVGGDSPGSLAASEAAAGPRRSIR